jgi:HD-like signal output (HDOD) protein
MLTLPDAVCAYCAGYASSARDRDFLIYISSVPRWQQYASVIIQAGCPFMLTPTGFAPLREQSITLAIEEMVTRAKSLYTLPAVATEVLQLTSDPTVSPNTLKECILRDPALTAKVLRVVNSSLFGLPREVSDLNQAIALLGIKPLKILVLGFSLPDNLFADVARDQLKWYWTNALTRAVAAREIGEKYFAVSSDEAFLVGLLQDLGVLVLARQLGPSYALMLRQTIDNAVDLRQAEEQALGFDHIKLTAAMLDSWHMPRHLVEAIAWQHDPRSLANEHRMHETLARVLHLANLTAELVGQHRLSVLPDLLEAGELYCGLDKKYLHDLIVDLQPKVNHLAEVLSLEVGGVADYGQILRAAHELMSELAETAFGPQVDLPSKEPATLGNLLNDTMRLRTAMDNFLARSAVCPTEAEPAEQRSHLETPTHHQRQVASRCSPWPTQFLEWLSLVAGACRSQRHPLSLIILAISDDTPRIDDSEGILSQWLDESCRVELSANALIERNADCQRTIVLPSCDRQEAVRVANSLIRHVECSLKRSAAAGCPVQGVISAGIASVTLPSKSFHPMDLLQTAERCLAAAQASETSVVKSLEIY